MTLEQHEQLQSLIPPLAELDRLGKELATVEGQLRAAEDLMAPLVRQWQEAQQALQRLGSLSWGSILAALSGSKKQRLQSAFTQVAEAEQLLHAEQAKLQPLREEIRQLEQRIEPLKPLRDEYERLFRTKESWVKRQAAAQETYRQLVEKEKLLYRVFIALDPVLIATQRVESVLIDLRHQLDAQRRGNLGREAVPLIKNLRDILVNQGAVYMNDLVLVDRCYAYAAQSTKLMLTQEAEGRQLLEHAHLFAKHVADDFLQARTAWQNAQRERIQYVERFPVP